MKSDNGNGLELAIEIENLRFAWRTGTAPLLKIERLQVPRGDRLFIAGPSGSGKSTLLSLVAGVVVPQEGKIRVNGQRLNGMHGAPRDRFRADQIGYIRLLFQECDREETTLVFVSHDTSLAGMFDCRVRLADINAI